MLTWTVVDCAAIDAACTRGQMCASGHVGRVVLGANVCHQGPLATGSCAESVTLT